VPAITLFGGTVEQEGARFRVDLDDSGLIVTNNHVVEGANSISVTLDDGPFPFTAQLVRTVPVADLAVIKISAPDLKAAVVGARIISSWRVGSGDGQRPWTGISATKGIVSALGVPISVGAGQNLYDLIPTDAAIIPATAAAPWSISWRV
jgi:S1-C subfamily serine protease